MARLQDDGPEFFRAGIYYREVGYWLTNLDKSYTSERYFEKAIEQGQKDDLRTYLGLCKALLKFARYNRAAQVAKLCKEIDPSYFQVRYVMLRSLFDIGEFSHSMVHAHQGYNKFPLTCFEHGIYQGNETVEDCVGRNTLPNTLKLLTPWINELLAHRNFMIEKLKEEVDELADFEEDDSKFKINDPAVQEDARFRKMQRVIGRIYLGCLATEKEFLQELFENPDLVQLPNKPLVEKLHLLAKRNFAKALSRQQIVRMRQPLYVLLFKRKLIPKGHRFMMEQEKKLRRNLIILEADFLMQRLHDLRMRKEYTNFFRTVDRVKDKFDSYPRKLFPMKQKCLDEIYNMVAWVYIDVRNLSTLKNDRMRKIYLKHQLGIKVAELPRDCDIGWVRAINRKRALRTFRRRLAMASQPLELAWLFHELAKHLINIGRYDLARFYTKKARKKSQEANNEQWVLNTYHLLLRIEISQNYRNEAKEVALWAITIAKKMGLDFLVDFYTNVINMVDEIDADKLNDSDPIVARQQLILKLMPQDMKPEVENLWRNMNAVPAKRRLSVMPGCKPVDKKFKLPCKRMTILPTPFKDPRKMARQAFLQEFAGTEERPGFVNFNEY